MKRQSTEEGNGVEEKKERKEEGATGSSLLRICGVQASRKGEREEMQDCAVMLENFRRLLEGDGAVCSDIQRLAFYAVYDGHNGIAAAKHCANHLHLVLAKKIPKGPDVQTVEQSLKRCIVETFKSVDEEFLSLATKVKPVLKDGTTATTVLILNNNLFVANIGDTKAIVCRHKVEEGKDIALTLTKDHNPQVFEERMRIQKAGGNVKDGRILGILEVSRSIGDGQYKNHGLTCIPDVRKCALTENDRYVVVGCDGLWKAFTNQDVLDFISRHLELAKKKEDLLVGREDKKREELRWEWVCGQLAGEAVRRGSGDNVTVVLIAINP